MDVLRITRKAKVKVVWAAALSRIKLWCRIVDDELPEHAVACLRFRSHRAPTEHGDHRQQGKQQRDKSAVFNSNNQKSPTGSHTSVTFLS